MFTVIRGARSKSTQAKVALMKLKLKAEGVDSIPQVSSYPRGGGEGERERERERERRERDDLSL